MTAVYPEERAQQLLPSVLNEEERARFLRTGQIIITGSNGGKYEIKRHTITGNVIPQQSVHSASGYVRVGAKLCAHPPMAVFNEDTRRHEPLPLTDGLISQILAIKADEDMFLRTAFFFSY